LGRRTTSSVSRDATGREFKNSRAEFDAGSACNSASGHGNATGKSSDAARRNGDAACANSNSGRASEPELARILFGKWNSEPNGAGIKFSGDSHSRNSDAACNRQSQHPEQSRWFAQRRSLRNFAGDNRWEFGHGAEFRIEPGPGQRK
jgi:hypothetical protein